MRFWRDAADDAPSSPDAPAPPDEARARGRAQGRIEASPADGRAFPEAAGERPGAAYPWPEDTQPGDTQASRWFPQAHPEPAFGGPPAPAFPRPAGERPGPAFPRPADELPGPAYPRPDDARARFPRPTHAEPEPASGQPPAAFGAPPAAFGGPPAAFARPASEQPGPAFPRPDGAQAGPWFPRPADEDEPFGQPPAAHARPVDERPGPALPAPAPPRPSSEQPGPMFPRPDGAQAGPWFPRPTGAGGEFPRPAFPGPDNAQASPWFPQPADDHPGAAVPRRGSGRSRAADERPPSALAEPTAFGEPAAAPPESFDAFSTPAPGAYFDVFARVAPPPPQTSDTFTSAPAAPAPTDDTPEAGAPAPSASPAAPTVGAAAQDVAAPAQDMAAPAQDMAAPAQDMAAPADAPSPESLESPATEVPAEMPSADTQDEVPATDAPAAGASMAETSPAETTRADLPRVETSPAETTQADLPRVETSPAETTQADLPRVETSPAEAPPAPDGSFPRPAAPRFTPVPQPTLAFPKPVAADPPAAVTAWRAPAAEEDEPSGPVLPTPPDDREKVSYIRRHSWILTVGSLISFPVLLFSQWQLMMQHHWFWLYLPFVIMGLIFLVFPMLTDGLSHGFNMRRHRQLVESWRPERYPSVDVFLPVCGEPIEVLHNTWHYVALMSQHYKGTVTAYVLDDSASPELKSMARDFGFAYATRPNRGWFKKSGNLLWGYEVSTGDYILLLDADFAPRYDLLDETLPYMEAYPDTGIVQTPQFFRVTDNQTWVERGAGAVQELFYRSIQTARADKGGAICVGSCAVYRRAALKDNEGMTLAEHSEDVRTGFDLHRLGWKLRYLPVALSTGNCPDNVLAFLNQQYRWCSGTVGLLFGPAFWRANLKLYTRMCYLSGFVYYIYTAVFTFVVPALTIAILLFVPGVLQFKNMIFMVPVLLYSGVIYPLWHHAPYRLEAWAVKLISGWAHVFAYWDAIRGKRLGWKPSGGDKKKQDGRRRFWACFIGWSCGSSLAWAGLAFWRMVTLNPANFVVLFILGAFECMIAARVVIQPAVDTQA